jgi:hypothetical protein
LSWYQITPLISACLQGNEKLCQLLIDSKANPNQKLSLEDYLMLKRLKLAAPRNIAKLDPKMEKPKNPAAVTEVYRQFGQTGPLNFHDFAVGKEFCLFELAAVNGHYGIASFLFEQYLSFILTSEQTQM